LQPAKRCKQVTEENAQWRYNGYKRLTSLDFPSLRDNMTNLELALNTLAEATTAELSKEHQPETGEENRNIALRGGQIVGNTRKEIEADLGKKIVSPINAKSIQALKDKE
jgi:hypothetical protein